MKEIIAFFSMCFLIAGVLGIARIDSLLGGIIVFLYLGIGIVLLLIYLNKRSKS